MLALVRQTVILSAHVEAHQAITKLKVHSGWSPPRFANVICLLSSATAEIYPCDSDVREIVFSSTWILTEAFSTSTGTGHKEVTKGETWA